MDKERFYRMSDKVVVEINLAKWLGEELVCGRVLDMEGNRCG